MEIRKRSTIDMIDILDRLSDPLDRIMHDAELIRRVKLYSQVQGSMCVLENAAELFSIFAPSLLRRHRDDFLSVLAILTGKPIEQVEEQPFVDTVSELRIFFAELFEMLNRKGENNGSV